MKLYAIVTSERASKGQGGEWLDIQVTNTQKDTLLFLKVFERKSSTILEMTRMKGNGSGPVTEIYALEDLKKGEKQKGEKKIRCNNCMSLLHEHDLVHMQDTSGDLMDACPKCKTDEYLMDL